MIKVFIHNYGPYVGEKICIDSSDYGGISVDFESLPKLILDLQEIEKNLNFYLLKDKSKEEMLEKMFKDIKNNPSIKKERMKKYQEDVMRIVYETISS